MGTTSPDALGYPDVGYTSGIRQAVKDLADATQTALLARAGRTFRPADATARAALSSSYTLRTDDRAYQGDTGVNYRYNGSDWEATNATILLDRNSTAYSLPNNAYTVLTDTYLTTTKAVAASVSSGVVTVVTAGTYEIAASASFTANATGARQLVVNKNSATVSTNPLLYAGVAGSSAVNGTVSAAKRVVLAAGDQLRLHLYQNSGGTLAMPTAADQAVGTFFHVSYVGPS